MDKHEDPINCRLGNTPAEQGMEDMGFNRAKLDKTVEEVASDISDSQRIKDVLPEGVAQPGNLLCKHLKWEIRGTDRNGFGWCFDCEREIAILVLFNCLKDHMEEAIDRSSVRAHLIMALLSGEVAEIRRAPANTESARRIELVEFLRSRGVKRALLDGEQFYMCENIDKANENVKEQSDISKGSIGIKDSEEATRKSSEETEAEGPVGSREG